MQQANLIRREDVHTLRGCIVKNGHNYQSWGFDNEKVLLDRIIKDSSVEVDYDALSRLNPENTRRADIDNTLLVWNSLQRMHPYLARDERFWVYLTHFPCRDYIWKRWFPSGTKGLATDASEKERKDLEKSIHEHFFAQGNTGFVRGNAVSRLWWWAYLASRHEGASLEDTLEVLLAYTEVRDALVSRSSITRSVRVFSAVMDVLTSRYRLDSRTPLLTSRSKYRAWFKEINRHGGGLLLEAMPREKLKDLFEELAVQAERGEQGEQGISLFPVFSH